MSSLNTAPQSHCDGALDLCPACGAYLPAGGQRYCHICGARQGRALRLRSLGGLLIPPLTVSPGRLPQLRAAVATLENLMERRAVALLFVPLLPLIALLFARSLMASPAGGLYLQPKPFVAILALLAAALMVPPCWRLAAAVARRREFRWQAHVGWLAISVALLLRWCLNEMIPLPEHMFEEWKRASVAFQLMHDGVFRLDHRMTDLVNVVGLRFADGDLDVLRRPLRLMGTLSVLVMGLALWRAGAGWPAILFGVFVMASLRMLVMAGGVVYETGSDVLAQTLLLFCMVGVFASSTTRYLWAAWAGFFAGLLLYGYPGYRLPVCAAFTLLALHGMASGSAAFRRHMMVAAAAFLLLMALTGAPSFATLSDTQASGHVHYDWMHRHGREHRLNSEVLATEGLTQWLLEEARDVGSYCSALFGLPYGHHDRRLIHPDGSEIPLAVGLVFLLGVIHALFRPRAGGLNRVLAAFLLLAVLVLALGPGNIDHSRIIVLVALLPFLSALMLDDLLRLLAGWRRHLAGSGAALVLLLALGLTLLNVAAVARQHAHPDTIDTYAQRKESNCRLIGLHPQSFTAYYVFNGDCNVAHSRWVLRGRTFDRDVLNNLSLEEPPPPPRPGTLYLLASDRDLTVEQRSAFMKIAQDLDSAATVETHRNSRDHLTGMSFCYMCEAAQ